MKNYRLKFLLFIIFSSLPTQVFPEDKFDNIEKKEKNYTFLISLKQNTSSQTTILSPEIEINFLHKRVWALGFSTGYFNIMTKEGLIKVFNFSKNIAYELRLFHPFYLSLGPSLSYLRPLEKNGKFNLTRHKIYSSNLSFSGKASFIIKPSLRSIIFKITFQPWFSLGLEEFKGIFISTSAGYRF